MFELEGELLKMITHNKYNVDIANLSDKKLLYHCAKEMYFDVKGQRNKTTGDRSLIKLLQSPAILAPGISTIFLSYDPDVLGDKLNLLLQEKHAGDNSNKTDEEIVAIADKLLENKCKSTKKR